MHIPKFVQVITGFGGALLIAFGISNAEFVSIIMGSIMVIVSILTLIEISKKLFGNVDVVSPLTSGSKWVGHACGNCGHRVEEWEEVINDICPKCKHYKLDGDVLHYGL